MSSDQIQFLSLRQIPARLSAQEAAWFLGFNEDQIKILIWEGILKPLGHPPENGVKSFALIEVKRHAEDDVWLAKANDALVKYWRRRNDGKLSNSVRRTASETASKPTVKLIAV